MRSNLDCQQTNVQIPSMKLLLRLIIVIIKLLFYLVLIKVSKIIIKTGKLFEYYERFTLSQKRNEKLIKLIFNPLKRRGKCWRKFCDEGIWKDRKVVMNSFSRRRKGQRPEARRKYRHFSFHKIQFTYDIDPHFIGT